MKCAAIALALQGATGLVPLASRSSPRPRPRWGSYQRRSTKLSSKASRAPPPAQKPARSGTDAPRPAEQRCLQNASHTHIRRGRRAPRVAKKPPSRSRAPPIKQLTTTHGRPGHVRGPPDRRQRGARPRDGLDRRGQVRPPRPAARRRRDGRGPLRPVHDLQPRRPDLGQPRPLRPSAATARCSSTGLHLAGYDIPKDEVANFRQHHRRRPAPRVPNSEHTTPGIEATTAPWVRASRTAPASPRPRRCRPPCSTRRSTRSSTTTFCMVGTAASRRASPPRRRASRRTRSSTT